MITNKFRLADVDESIKTFAELFDRKDAALAVLLEHAREYLKTGDDLKTIDHLTAHIEYLLKFGAPEYCVADGFEDSTEGGMTAVLCSDCPALCCRTSGMICLDEEDLKNLGKAFGIHWKRWKKRYAVPIPLEVREQFDAEAFKGADHIHLAPFMIRRTRPCQFLQRDFRCSIYPARPKACRVYPMERDETNQYMFKIHPNCRYTFNLIVSEVVGRRDPSEWKNPEPWMDFISRRGGHDFQKDGFNPKDDQFFRIRALMKGNEEIWREVKKGGD